MKINGMLIEAIMAEQGLTKKQLAEKSGVSYQSVVNLIKRGTCEPRTAGKMAAGLGIKVTEIIVN